MTRVLALTKYGREAASTRQRLMQFLPTLQAAGFDVEVRALLDDDYVRALATGASYAKGKLAKAFIQRFHDLRRAPEYDLLWVYAELFPGLPAPFEKLVTRARKPIIYDFDDAFFHAHERSRWLRDKLRPLVGGAKLITAGNEYLAGFVRKWNENVRIVPTVVDTAVYRPRSSLMPNRCPVIGWIGSPSTWSYVRPVLPLLAEICRGGRAKFLAVGAGSTAMVDRFDGMESRDWSEYREVGDIQNMDIGIMPLPAEAWAQGKCGYKLIQYMACGLPAVASPIGVNKAIVREGKTGYLAASQAEWSRALNHLIATPQDRARLGAAGRARVVEEYSLSTWAPRLTEMFLSLDPAHRSLASRGVMRVARIAGNSQNR